MTSLQPSASPIEPMKSRDAADRVDFCRAMLYLHDFLSGAENDKVKKRIAAWKKKHGYGETNRTAKRQSKAG